MKTIIKILVLLFKRLKVIIKVKTVKNKKTEKLKMMMLISAVLRMKVMMVKNKI